MGSGSEILGTIVIYVNEMPPANGNSTWSVPIIFVGDGGSLGELPPTPQIDVASPDSRCHYSTTVSLSAVFLVAECEDASVQSDPIPGGPSGTVSAPVNSSSSAPVDKDPNRFREPLSSNMVAIIAGACGAAVVVLAIIGGIVFAKMHPNFHRALRKHREQQSFGTSDQRT